MIKEELTRKITKGEFDTTKELCALLDQAILATRQTLQEDALFVVKCETGVEPNADYPGVLYQGKN